MRVFYFILELFIFISLIFSGCDNFKGPGSFELKFSWEKTQAPDFSAKDYYLWVKIVDKDDPGKLYGSDSRVVIRDNGSFNAKLQGSEYGKNKFVAQLEIRDESDTEADVLYSGKSQPFSIQRGVHEIVNVPMKIEALPGVRDGEKLETELIFVDDKGKVKEEVNAETSEVGVLIAGITPFTTLLISEDDTSFLNYPCENQENCFFKMHIFDEKNYDDNTNVYTLPEKHKLPEKLEHGVYRLYAKILNSNDRGITVRGDLLVDDMPPEVELNISEKFTSRPESLEFTVYSANELIVRQSIVFSMKNISMEEIVLKNNDFICMNCEDEVNTENEDNSNFESRERELSKSFTYKIKTEKTELLDEFLSTEEKRASFNIRVLASDTAGNESSVTEEFTLDKGIPNFESHLFSYKFSDENEFSEVLEDADEVVWLRKGSVIRFSYEAAEELAPGFPVLRVDEKSFDILENGDMEFRVSGYETEGEKNITVTLRDLAGNTAVVEKQGVFGFDFTSPLIVGDAVITPNPANSSSTISVNFSFNEKAYGVSVKSADEKELLFSCKTSDNRSFVCERDVTSIDESGYEIVVSAIDSVENRTENALLGSFVIDRRSPAVKLLSLSTNVVNSSTESYSFTIETDEYPAERPLVRVGQMNIKSLPVISPEGTTSEDGPWTLSYGVSVNGNEPEGSDFAINVDLRDSAGNLFSGALGGAEDRITFDFTPPEINSSSIVPYIMNILTEEITIDLYFNELVHRETVKVYDSSGKINFYNCQGMGNYSAHIFCNYDAEDDEDPPSDTDFGEFHTIFVEAFDKAGNKLESIALTDFPFGVEVDLTPPEISNGGVSEDEIKAETPYSVYFKSSEELYSFSKISVGGVIYSVKDNCEFSDTGDSFIYECGFISPEIGEDGLRNIMIDGRDLRENPIPPEHRSIGEITWDFTSPEMIEGSGKLRLTPEDYRIIADPQAATNGTTVTVSFTLSEAVVNIPHVKLSGLDMDFELSSSSGDTFFVYEFTLSDAGEVDFTDTVIIDPSEKPLEDSVGNQQNSVMEVAELRIDTIPPSPPDVESGDGVRYVRIPWGVETEEESDNKQPTFFVYVLREILGEEEYVLIYDGADKEKSSLIKTFTFEDKEEQSEGVYYKIDLDRTDRKNIYIALGDTAGNQSGTDFSDKEASLVRNIEWTASMNNKVAESTYENPHMLFTQRAHTGMPDISDNYDTEEKTLEEKLVVENSGRWIISENRTHKTEVRQFSVFSDPLRGLPVLHGGESDFNYDPVSHFNTDVWDGYFFSNVSSSGPEAFGYAAATDPLLGKTFLFGGGKINYDIFGSISKVSLDNTWSWDGKSWIQIYPQDKPTARLKTSMVYNYSSGNFIFYGGLDDFKEEGGVSLDETWLWNGENWIQLIPEDPEGDGNPGTAYGHSMVFDHNRKKILLLGGQNDSDNDRHSVWELNEWNDDKNQIKISWKKLLDEKEFNSATDPDVYYSTVYDKNRDRVFVWAENDSGSYYLYSWTSSKAKWNRHEAADPESDGSPQTYGELAYDNINKKLMLFTEKPSGAYSGWEAMRVWEWTGNSWMRHYHENDMRPERRKTAVAYIGNATILLFGGERDGECLGGTWKKTASALFRVQDEDAGGLTAPEPRKNHDMVYDKTRSVVVLYGGENDDGDTFTDTWEYEPDCGDVSCWTKTDDNGPECDPLLAYDNTYNHPVLFCNSSGDIYTYSSSSGDWHFISSSGDSPSISIAFADMVWDYSNDKLLFFGGRTLSYNNNNTFHIHKEVFMGLPVYIWTKLEPEESPPARIKHCMASSSKDELVFMTGGSGDDLKDSWIWTGNNWETVNVETPDLSSSKCYAAWDEETDYIFTTSYRGYNIFRSEKPAAVFHADLVSSGHFEDFNMHSVRLNWEAGAASLNGNETVDGTEIFIWDKERWLQLGSNMNSHASPGVITTEITDSSVIDRLSRQSFLKTAIMPSGLASSFAVTKPLAVEKVELTVSYKIGDPVEYFYDMDRYYFSGKFKKTWQEARKDCFSRGMDLVSIDSAEEQAALEEKILSDTLYWIGIHDFYNTGSFRLISGKQIWQEELIGGYPLAYTNWSVGQPGIGEKDCVGMVKKTGWGTSNCKNIQSYICEVPEKPYFIATERRTRTDALGFCTDNDATLVSFDGESEYRAILSSLDDAQDFWIGLAYSEVSGIWEWVSGDPAWEGDENGHGYTWAAWNKVAPEQPQSPGDYSMIHGDFNMRWGTASGTEEFPFICELEPMGCFPIDLNCDFHKECCSNVCSPSGVCVHCLSLQENCSATYQCCGDKTVCQESNCCFLPGDSCKEDSNCCKGKCVGFKNPLCQCKSAEEICSFNGDCCSGICSKGVCSKSPSGGVCNDSNDCVSNKCLKNICK